MQTFNRTSGKLIFNYCVALVDIRIVKMGQSNTLLLGTSEATFSYQNVAFLFLKALVIFSPCTAMELKHNSILHHTVREDSQLLKIYWIGCSKLQPFGRYRGILYGLTLCSHLCFGIQDFCYVLCKLPQLIYYPQLITSCCQSSENLFCSSLCFYHNSSFLPHVGQAHCFPTVSVEKTDKTVEEESIIPNL